MTVGCWPWGESLPLASQVLPTLCQAAPGLQRYVATDILPGCGPALLKAANNAKLSFEARPSPAAPAA